MRTSFEGIKTVNCSFDSLITPDNGDCGSCAQEAVFSDEVTGCLSCNKSFDFDVYSAPDYFPLTFRISLVT